MQVKPKFLSLPIYSIANYKQYYYFSGGGGGRTGIPNEILIYKGLDSVKDRKDPIKRVETGSKICENIVVHAGRNILVASENADIVIYGISDGGQTLNKLASFQSDYSPKNATINAISISRTGFIMAAAGDDMIVKFYNIKDTDNIDMHYQYQVHKDPIRNIDNNQKELFLSTDKYQVVITNARTKQMERVVHCDELSPSESVIQSAYFQKEESPLILIAHYLPRMKSFVSREVDGDPEHFESMVVSNDQSCQTAYNPHRRLLGLACGNGSTYVINPLNFQKYGSEKKHNYIITGNVIENNHGAYLTGTPECSYNVQHPKSGTYLVLVSVLVSLILMLVMGLQLEGEL